MPEIEKRVCLECKTELKGRRDKKFCDDQCRNIFNNRLNSDPSQEIRHINLILKKNRKILEDILPPDGKTKVTGKKLRDLGFDQTYMTHTYTTQAGSVYRYCYEFGYLPLEGDFFLIVKKEKK